MTKTSTIEKGKISDMDLQALVGNVIKTELPELHGFTGDISFDYYIPLVRAPQVTGAERSVSGMLRGGKPDYKGMAKELYALGLLVNHGRTAEEDGNFRNIHFRLYSEKKGIKGAGVGLVRVSSGWTWMEHEAEVEERARVKQVLNERMEELLSIFERFGFGIDETKLSDDKTISTFKSQIFENYKML